MTPAKIYCDDALQLVSKLGTFDYIITDPPYPTGGESSMRTGSSVKDAREMVDSMAQSFITAVLQSVNKSERFSIWLFCDWRQVSYFSSILRGMGYPSQSCIVWNKMRSSLSARYHPMHELILWASKKAPKNTYLGRDLIELKPVSVKTKKHAFDKPPELVEKFASAFPAGRVLDPFCGAGGLLVGAQRLGWEVVGIDIDKHFCDTARLRLAG